jgi:hypothetical protein
LPIGHDSYLKINRQLESFAATETYAMSLANRLFFFLDINTSFKEEAHEHQLSHQDTRLNGFLRIERKGNI